MDRWKTTDGLYDVLSGASSSALRDIILRSARNSSARLLSPTSYKWYESNSASLQIPITCTAVPRIRYADDDDDEEKEAVIVPSTTSDDNDHVTSVWSCSTFGNNWKEDYLYHLTSSSSGSSFRSIYSSLPSVSSLNESDAISSGRNFATDIEYENEIHSMPSCSSHFEQSSVSSCDPSLSSLSGPNADSMCTESFDKHDAELWDIYDNLLNFMLSAEILKESPDVKNIVIDEQSLAYMRSTEEMLDVSAVGDKPTNRQELVSAIRNLTLLLPNPTTLQGEIYPNDGRSKNFPADSCNSSYERSSDSSQGIISSLNDAVLEATKSLENNSDVANVVKKSETQRMESGKKSQGFNKHSPAETFKPGSEGEVDCVSTPSSPGKCRSFFRRVGKAISRLNPFKRCCSATCD